jgi:hypothetical protein
MKLESRHSAMVAFKVIHSLHSTTGWLDGSHRQQYHLEGLGYDMIVIDSRLTILPRRDSHRACVD